jgi:hypothetical protein
VELPPRYNIAPTDQVDDRLGAAHRKAMMLIFARAAALRLQLHLDPGCSFEL